MERLQLSTVLITQWLVCNLSCGNSGTRSHTLEPAVAANTAPNIYCCKQLQEKPRVTPTSRCRTRSLPCQIAGARSA